MQLIDAKEFAGRYFSPASQPDKRTIRKWVDEGEVPGRVVGGKYFIDAEAFEKSTGNDLADVVLGVSHG